MRVATVRLAGRERLAFVSEDHGHLVVPEDDGTQPRTVPELIQAGPDLWHEAQRKAGEGHRIPISEAELLAPLPRPEKNLFALGLNYTDHGEEAYQKAGRPYRRPKHPVVFTKDRVSVAGPHGPIALDYSLSQEFDWEVELAVVIGRHARKVAESEAFEHVFGYCVANDITARDLQTRHRQYYLSKSLAASCPLGPWITTADEVRDPHDLAITLTLNGEPRQTSCTSQMVFGVARTIAEISRIVPLEPGDIILTGTPAGTGFAAQPPRYLKPGDSVECSIEGLGTLSNRIAASDF
ncbi:fumarylacetoacetate hydrolase family protein [Streptomyces sp. RPT161]|uniref:fumarylacetoacetate hydrolase family protein n=1 Tax=Streptomyces sp. RPT161 TaxID=3015993 RepID=UPI0022B8FB5C|nr:fumarylacetoacetate hydrolase family protein [Streptomyces sp. RPT161]